MSRVDFLAGLRVLADHLDPVAGPPNRASIVAGAVERHGSMRLGRGGRWPRQIGRDAIRLLLPRMSCDLKSLILLG